MSIRIGKQPIDHLTVLNLGCWRLDGSQVAAPVDVGHTRSLNEDLLNVGPGEDLRQRSKVGNGPDHSPDHLRGVVE